MGFGEDQNSLSDNTEDTIKYLQTMVNAKEEQIAQLER